MRGCRRAAVLTVALLLASFGVPATGVAAPDPGSATVPCPSVPATRPPRPTPPRVDPVSRTVGGTGLATPGLVAPAGATRPPAVSATSWLVADLDTGAVLGGCGPHEYATPASVQKLLLAATMLPRLDPGQLVTATHGDVDIEPGSSAMGLVEGGHYPLESVWLGLLLTSGNDAANLLARLGGGPDGLPGGVRAMNEQARRLGALQTHAVTPSGLDGPGQFTSAYDLALIARACFADARFRRYELTERARVPAQPALRRKGYEIQNDNQLIQRYPGALGGKTGFTDLARHTYVGAAERGGRRLVVTLLGAEVDRQRGWQQGATLLDWGFALPRDASVGRLVAPGETLTPSPTTGATLPVVDTGRAATHSDGLARVGRWWTLLVVAVGLVGTGLLTSLFSRRRRPLRATGGDADPG